MFVLSFYYILNFEKLALGFFIVKHKKNIFKIITSQKRIQNNIPTPT